MSEDLQRDLDQAVTDVLNAISPGVSTAWILLSHQANFDDEGNSISSYPIILMNGSLPEHSIRGLLDIAQDHVRGVGKWAHVFEDEEEETLFELEEGTEEESTEEDTD